MSAVGVGWHDEIREDPAGSNATALREAPEGRNQWIYGITTAFDHPCPAETKPLTAEEENIDLWEADWVRLPHAMQSTPVWIGP